MVKKRGGKARIVASFDVDPAEGEFGIGLDGGALYDIKEIGTLLEKITLEWVKAVRSVEEEGKPIAPRWIANDAHLSEFFETIGYGVSLSEVRDASDQNEAAYMVQENDWAYFAKELIWTLTSASGWDGAENEDHTNLPLYSTTHTN